MRFRRLFSFSGRDNRRTWWTIQVLWLTCLTVVVAIAEADERAENATAPRSVKFIKDSLEQDEGTLFSSEVGQAVALCSLIAFFIVGLSSNVRRLHDRDHSGFYLLLNLIPVVGSVVLIIVLGFMPGQGVVNQYGHPPTKREVLVQQDADEAAQTLREVMAREPIYGPDTRPWRERRTTKPFPEYRSKEWPTWRFQGSENSEAVVLPEECIGVVFPDDWILVNNRWRLVTSISTSYSEPVAFISK